MYPKLVDQVAGGVAKWLQKTTEVFHEFPECSTLSNTDRISIKLNDIHVNRALQQSNWRPDAERLDSISFLIRDEDHRKRQLMHAQVQSGAHHGLIVMTEGAKPETVMGVGLPKHSVDSLGKLMHPSKATLFKLMRDPVGPNFSLTKAGSDGTVVIRVEKVMMSLQSLGKAVGFLGTNCVYWLKAPDNQTVLGHIRTKLVMNSHTLVVKFSSTHRDAQLRAAMLGVALLLMLSEVYPQLKTLITTSTNE